MGFEEFSISILGTLISTNQMGLIHWWHIRWQDMKQLAYTKMYTHQSEMHGVINVTGEDPNCYRKRIFPTSYDHSTFYIDLVEIDSHAE
jgi:hypothetical protein